MIGRRCCISETRLLRVLDLARKIAVNREPICDEANVLKEFLKRLSDAEKIELWAIVAIGRGTFKEYDDAITKAKLFTSTKIVESLLEQTELSTNLYFGIRKVIGKIAGDENEKEAFS